MTFSWLTKLGTASAALAMAGAMATGAVAQDDWPDTVTVGTASQGGTYFIYGAGWADLVQESLDISTATEATGGPVQNMALVNAGDLEFGMTTMGPGYDAWIGENEIAPGVEMRDVRALFPMYQTPFQIIALADSDIDSVEDLNGKTVGVGPRGGTPGTYFPRFLEQLGVDFDPQYGGASDLGSQLQDGLIDAFAFGAGVPIAAFSEVAAQRDVNIFAFTDDEIQTLLDENPSLAPFTIPGDTYDAVPEDQDTVAMWNFAIANKDIPESLGYEIMKVVLDNNDRMMEVHKAAAETLPEHYDKNSFMFFHPGAVKYFQEKGYEIDEDLIPPEMK